MSMDEPTVRHTCLKLELPKSEDLTIFVKGTWFDSRFDLSITDGRDAWVCHAMEEEVRDRADQWDQPASEYVALAERHLGFQLPESLYGFADAGDGFRREEIVYKTESVERLKAEAEKCLQQSEKISNDKVEFESALYAKFLGVLNSKKAKLRELRDQLVKQGAAAGKLPLEEEESTDKTESFDEKSDDLKSEEESSENVTNTSKGMSRPRGCKRALRK